MGTLITGGTGFIGAQIVRILLEAGADPFMATWTPKEETPTALTKGKPAIYGLIRAEIEERQTRAALAERQRRAEIEERQRATRERARQEAASQQASKPNTESRPAQQEPEIVGSASGFFVSPSHHLLTNAHAIDSCEKVTIRFRGSYEPAELIAVDSVNDIALLRAVSERPNEFGHFRASGPRVGESIVVLGYPLSPILGQSIRATSRIVSGGTGIMGNTVQFQITADIQPGNSGGPVLDETGQVIGMIVSSLDDIAAIQATGSIPQNVNFAIRPDSIKTLLSANGIDVPSREDEEPISVPAIVDYGSTFIAQVYCYQ